MPVMKARRRAGSPPQTPYRTTQGSAAAPLNHGAPIPPQAALTGAYAHGLAAPNMFTFGNNLERPGQQVMDMGGGNLRRRGPLPNWSSPYSNPDLEYVYLGSPQTSQGSPPVSNCAVPSISPGAHILQQPQGNFYIDHHHGLSVANMPTTQQTYMVPTANYQPPLPPPQRFPTQQHVDHRAATPSQLSHGLYGVGDHDLQQLDEIWSTLDSDILVQASVDFNVNHGDVGMVEAFGFDQSGASMPAAPPVASHARPGGATGTATVASDYRPWTMLSHSISDEAESSSSIQAGYPSSNSTGMTTTTTSSTRRANAFPPRQVAEQRYAPRQVPERIAQNSDQGFRHGVALPNVIDPRVDYMDTVVGEAISDGVSSTTSPGTDHSGRHNQSPYGYNSQNVPAGGSTANFREQHGAAQRSSRPENNFRDQIPTNQAAFGSTGSHASTINATKASENDFSSLMATGQPGSRQPGESRWAVQLLNLCAAAIASSNISRTQHLMWVLNDLASVGGDVNQRFAAYGLRALFCRITGRLMEAAASFLHPRHQEQESSFGPKTVHRALVKFHEHVPWHQNCYSITSQTLLEVCAGKNRLHLIDIGAGKGIEWPIFIDALVSRSGGPPSILRMTMIRDLRREQYKMITAKPADSEAADFMTRLVKFASLLGLHLEVNMVQKPLECVTREDLRLRDGEVLAVVCQFRLHRLSDDVSESQSSNPSGPRLCPRDEFLDFLYQLEPHVFIHSDNDWDNCSPDFLTRCQSAMGFWWNCFDCMDVGYNGRDGEERQIIEYEAAMMMLNMVACEGIARIERNETYLQWARRIKRAGFVPRVLSDEARKVSHNLMQSHSEFWDVAFVDTNVASLLWRKQPTTFTSVWKTASCHKNSCKCSMLHS